MLEENGGNKDLVSIVVPVFNVEKTLERCVNSITQQTYSNIDIILVDDGSTDDSGKICEKLATVDSRIRVVHQLNSGLSAARNTGIECSRGECILFVDSDDSIHCDMVKMLVDRMNVSNADMVLCNYRLVEQDGTVLGISQIEGTFEGDKFSLYEALLSENGKYFVPAWNKLYRRYLWDEYRFLQGRLREDEFAIHHLAEKCERITVVGEPLYDYYQNPKGIMHNENTKLWMDFATSYIDRLCCYRRMLSSQNRERLINTVFEHRIRTLDLLVYVYEWCRTKENKQEYTSLVRMYFKSGSFIERHHIGINNRIKEFGILFSPKALRRIINRK